MGHPSRGGLGKPIHSSTHPSIHPSPHYALRKGFKTWKLILAGAEADLHPQKGLLYAALLLLDPPPEPIHALDLVARVPALYRKQLALTTATNPETGATVVLDKSARLPGRSFAADDAEALRRLLAQRASLEALLEDDTATEPEKLEAMRELDQIHAFLSRDAARTRTSAEKLVRAVRAALRRFQEALAQATDQDGAPHPVLRPFAQHLAQHLLAPSARHSGRVNARLKAGLAGRFTYEPPPGVVWTT